MRQVFAFSVCVLAATFASAQDTVTFTDDFNGCVTTSGLGQRWDTIGTWYCRNDRARGESPFGFAIADTPAVADTDVRALVQLNGSSNGSGVVARWIDERNFYSARVFVNSLGPDFVALDRWENGQEIHLGNADAAIDRNASDSLRLVVTGSGTDVRLEVYIDGQRVIDTVDTSGRLPAGKAGLLNGGAGTNGPVGFASRSQFDNFVLTGKRQAALAFEDNFDDCTSTSGLGPDWDTLGIWYCRNGRARGESTRGFALARTAELVDTDVSALVQLNGQSNASGVVARWADANNYYTARVFVNATGPSFVTIARVTGGQTISLGTAEYDRIDRNFSNRVRLVVREVGASETSLELFMDGALVLEVTDTSGARPRGLAGLINGGTGREGDTGFISRSQFDSFVLRVP